jgi:signal transduction histidine kinase
LQTCRANEIVSATLDMFSALAEGRELTLERRTPQGDIELECDRDRVIQALGNLVANSIKVTPAGGAVRVGFERDANEVVFRVEDSGPGLSQDELAKVFDRYWRGDRTSYKGAGLGLAIAKGIVDAHRGRIWAESRLGEGSRFLIALPAS